MGSLNKVMLIGSLGRDPECRTMGNGNPVVNLSVATSEKWRDRQSGEKKENTQWHKVVIFNENLCKVAQNYLKKGSKVYVEGALQTGTEWGAKACSHRGASLANVEFPSLLKKEMLALAKRRLGWSE